ncbi:MAG: hypothetical protein ABWY05_00285, partial [Noviherbaspirillum sp.]
DGLSVASDSSTTVESTSVNDAPSITGSVPAQAVGDNASLNPFAAMTIADADNPAQQLTVRVTLDDPARGSLSGTSGSYDAATGVYAFSGTAAAATAELRALVLTPAANRAAPGLTETTRLTISTDDGLATGSDANTTVVATSINDAPSIAGAAPGQTVADNGSLRPFAAVTIGDADSPAQQLTVRVTLDNPSQGSLSAAAGSYDAATGVYTFSGTAAQTSGALQALAFTPLENRLARGMTKALRFTLTADDGQAIASDATTSVIVTSANDAPAITGAVSSQTVDDNASLHPFAAVTIADADNPAQQLTVRVTLHDSARGALSGASGSYDAASGSYTFSGSAVDATAALRALVFTPAANRVAPGLAESTRLTVSVDDGLATAMDANTAVIVTSVNDAPSITGATPVQSADDNASLRPFAAVTIADADSPAQQLSVLVTLDGPPGGMLSGAAGSYDAARGVYRFTGTAAEASEALRTLMFTPAANRLSPGLSETTRLTLIVDDGQAQASAVAGTAVMSVNDVPVLGLPAGLQMVSDKGSLALFAGMTITDADSPAQQLALRITLDRPAAGRLSGAGGSYDAAAGIYTLSGTAAQLEAAVQALLFAPAENRVSPGQAETVSFSISVSDGTSRASGGMSVQALSVNDPPAVLAGAARGVQDGTALAIVLAASDPDGDGVSLLITAAPTHGALYLDAAGLSPLLPGVLLRLGAGASSAQVYFVPEAGWHGDTGFSYAAVDAHGLAGADAAFSITLAPALRIAAQTTAAPALDTPAAPAAQALEPAERPAAAAPVLLAQSAMAAPPGQRFDVAAPPPETVLPAQTNPQAALAAAPARSAWSRVAQSAAMIAVTASSDAGADAVFSADLGAAQTLADARIERASAAARSETLNRSLDDMRDSVKAAAETEHRIVGSSVAVGASVSVGYVIWLLRGGVLATSLLSSLPAWRFVDPLPVLARMRQGGDEEEDSDDSLESLVAGDDDRDGHGAGRLQPPEPNR